MEKCIVRTSNGLAKSGRSLVLSAKAFPGGDICLPHLTTRAAAPLQDTHFMFSWGVF